MQRRYRIIVLVMLLLGISLGYALLTSNLNILGVSEILNPTWDIHFENVQVKSGSVTAPTPTIDTDQTTVSYSVTLNTPGDYFEFTVDAVNAGTIDGMVDVVLNKLNNVVITSLPAYLEYSATYEDGIPIETNQLLKHGQYERFKVRVAYKSDITKTDLPSTEQTINLSFTVTYVQSDLDGITTKEAYFLTGPEVNIKMKNLAGDDTTENGEKTDDSNVTAIKYSLTEPTQSNKESKNIVSKADSPYPIYMWFDNGTIYWWSEDKYPNINEDASFMFNRCMNLEDIQGIEHFDFSRSTTLRCLFGTNVSLKSISVLKNWDVSNVINMYQTFCLCLSLESLNGLEKWDTSNVTTMYGLFMGHSSVGGMIITDLTPLSNWDVSKVEDLRAIFQRCIAITSLEGLENWEISNVKNIWGAFQYNYSLSDISSIENWDTSSVTDMTGVFQNCDSLLEMDLSKWNTANVTDMKAMFNGLDLLEELDISSFDTSKVTSFKEMFKNSTSLKHIYVGDNWDTSNNTDDDTMVFPASSSLPNYDSSNPNRQKLSYAHTGTGGYLTYKSN